MNPEAVLNDAVCETFASLAFLDLMPTRSAIGKQEEPCVSIDVFEPLSCSLSISVPSRLLDEIALSATGGEVAGEELEGAKRDLLLEVANVVAGAFASRVQDAGAHVELGLPRLESPAASKTWQRFETEASWVDVSLEVKTEPGENSPPAAAPGARSESRVRAFCASELPERCGLSDQSVSRSFQRSHLGTRKKADE